MSNLNYAHIMFKNSNHGYVTDLSVNTTVESVTDYFLHTSFDVGIYPTENMQSCIGIHFYDKKNDADHFIGEISQSNLDNFGLNTAYKNNVKELIK